MLEKILNKEKFISDQEFKEVIKNIKDKNLEEKIILKFLYHSGLKPEEIIDLKIRNIDFEKNEIYIIPFKDKKRIISISKEFIQNIQNYILNIRNDIQPRHKDIYDLLFLNKNGYKFSENDIYNIAKKYFGNQAVKLLNESPRYITVLDKELRKKDKEITEYKNNEFYIGKLDFYLNKDTNFSYFPNKHFLGFFYNLLSNQQFWEAKKLHDDYKLKPFTISRIMPQIDENKNNYKLKGNKKYYVILTFLNKKIYKKFFNAINSDSIIYSQLNQTNMKHINFNIKQNRGITSPKKIYKESESLNNIKLTFQTITHIKDKFGTSEEFPKPSSVFLSLLKKWMHFGHKELSLTLNDLEKIIVMNYNIESDVEKIKDDYVKGFKGRAKYGFDRLNKKKQKELDLLVRFGEIAGLGIRTTMGYGQLKKRN